MLHIGCRSANHYFLGGTGLLLMALVGVSTYGRASRPSSGFPTLAVEYVATEEGGGLRASAAKIPRPWGQEEESSSDVGEWLVLGEPAEVRRDKDPGSQLLGYKEAGLVVVGRRSGHWLALEDEPGFVQILSHGNSLLTRRLTSYVLISHGCCADLGLFPITDVVSCGVAAQALSLRNTQVLVVSWPSLRPLPEGCYIKEGESGSEVFFNKKASDVGNGAAMSIQMNGAVENRSPICSTNVYPTSTTTTSTTSSMTSITSSTQTTSTWTEGFPSLLCFAVMRAHTTEEQLLKAQLEGSLGIFACDEYFVISQSNVSLGRDRTGSEVRTWVNPAPAVQMGNVTAGQKTASWLNTATFIKAFDMILHDPKKRAFRHDWLVKLDPDTVFFPDRLRLHLKDHTPSNSYLVNCKRGGETLLFGALEVFSKQALYTYRDTAWRCKEMGWSGWGEDMYFQKCMDSIGVSMIADFAVVADAYCCLAGWCPNTACTDGWRAAFHPYKDIGSWFQCNSQARRK